MNRFLGPLARLCAAHPWRALLLWVVGAVAAFALALAVGAPAQEDWDAPGTPSQRGVDLLRAHLPEAGNASAQVVVHDREEEPVPEAEVVALDARLSALPHVLAVDPPRVSADGATVLLTVRYDVPVTHRDLMGHAEPLEDAVAATRSSGLQVALGGELPATAQAEVKGTGELIGIAGALVILLLMFGSVVAAGLPVLVAVAGLAVGTAGITVLCGVMSVSPSAPMVASMVGLGVGIDYALLLLTRTRDHLADGLPVVDAVERTAVTAGRSVVLAGATVLVSLLGLRLAGLATYSAFGIATAITVLAVVVSTLVLVPALCGLLHRRLLPRRVRRARPGGLEPTGTSRSERWANRVAARPLAWALAAVTVMLLLAAPVLEMRTWPQSGSDDPTSMQSRQAYDLMSEAFGPGAPTPYVVVVDRSRVGDAAGGRRGARPACPCRSRGCDRPRGLAGRWRGRDQRRVDVRRQRRPHPGPGGLVAHLVARGCGAGRLERALCRLLLGPGREGLAGHRLRGVGLGADADADVPLTRRRREGGRDEPAERGCGVRRGHRDVPVGLGTRPARGRPHAADVELDADPDVRHPLRSLDGLRGVPARPDPGGLRPHGRRAGSVARGLAATSGVITAAAAVMVLVFLGFATEVGTLVKMLGFGLGWRSSWTPPWSVWCWCPPR